ncbi:MAG: hypothetical protein ACQEW8_07250 [Actinomycetota bacterium]
MATQEQVSERGGWRTRFVRRAVLLLVGSVVVGIVSTAVREYVYFAPISRSMVVVGEVVLLRQLRETALIAICSLPALGVILLVGRRVGVFSWRRAFATAAVANFLLFPVGFFFLSFVWWSFPAAAVWAFLLAVGGTVAHALALLVADTQRIRPR